MNAFIMLSGHGEAIEVQGKTESGTGRFVFLSSDAKAESPLATGVTGAEIQEKLALLKCRSVLLLDTCHSGAAAADKQNDSFPGRGFGPIILSACQATEEATEGKEHGAFTLGILEALDGKLRHTAVEKVERDPDGDGFMSLGEMMNYVKRVTPKIKIELRNDGKRQNPAIIPSITFRDPQQITLVKLP